VRLLALITSLGLPSGEVAIAVVNGSAVALEEALVSDGDCVQLYPPIGGGNNR
jgi:sulfur carrier protein ThiS